MELWFTERHTPSVKFSIKVDRQLYTAQSEFQRIDVFECEEFGRFLTLDGYMMLTERDEFIYHEMMVHVPLAVLGDTVKKVLVIGGGGIYYGSQNASAGGSQQLIVYNWGEYMDSDVIDIFEEETGIHVVYEEYETNEIMYPKIKSGAISYDLVCPSDYMIQKMIQNDLLQPINFDHIPNASNIGDMYYETSEQFDPGNLYSIPYCWGTVGILYNKKW